MTLYYPLPLLGWSFGTWYCRELCRCGHVEKTCDMIGLIDYLLRDYTNGASNIYDNIPTTSRVPTSYPSTVSSAHEPFFNYFDDALMSSGHVRARVVAPSLNTSPRSPVSVLRSSQPWADRRLLRPAAEPMTFRPAAAATSAPPFLLRG